MVFLLHRLKKRFLPSCKVQIWTHCIAEKCCLYKPLTDIHTSGFHSQAQKLKVLLNNFKSQTKAQTNDETRRATSNLHRMSTPEYVTCNFARNKLRLTVKFCSCNDARNNVIVCPLSATCFNIHQKLLVSVNSNIVARKIA